MSAADFHFACHRCGHCCRVAHGRVWLDDSDLAPIAALRGSSVAALLRDAVVQVGDRLSLRERADGGCVLLEGSDCCTVYAARPAQCRNFPYWDTLLEDQTRLAEAAAYCPGIQRFPDAQTAARVLPQVRALLEASAASTACGDAPGERWGSSLEADLHLASGEDRRVLAPQAVAELRVALERLAADSGYPWSYGPWQRLLEDRTAGWRARGAWPGPLPA